MTQNTRTATVVLQYQVNNASLQNTIQSNKAVAGSFQSVAQAAAQLGLSTSQIAQVNAQVGQMPTVANQAAQAYNQVAQASVASANIQSQSIQKVIHDIGDLGRDIESIPEPDLSAFGVPDDGSGGSGGTSIGGARSSLRAGGMLLGAQAGGGDLRIVSQVITLFSTFGPAGVVVGVLAEGMKLLTANSEAAAAEIKASSDAYYQVGLAAQSSTREQLQQQLKDAQVGVDFATEFAKNANIAALQYAQSHPEALLPVVGITVEGLEGMAGTFGGLKDSAAAADTKLRDAQNVLAALTIVLDGTTGAVNSDVAAWKEQQKSIEDSNKALIGLYDQQAQTNTDLAALRRTGTTDQINEELAANKDRETIIQTYLLPNVTKIGLTSAEASAKILALNSELGDLTLKDQQLLQAVLPVVAAREAETKLLADQKSQSDAVNSVLQDINKTQVSLAAASQKTADALTAVGQAETDHANNLITIQQTYDAAQQDALSKKNTQLAKIDQQAAERQLEQKENDNYSILQAVARGDLASAQATLAQQKVKDTQDQRQVAQQKDDAQQNYTDALAQAKAQNVKMLASEQDRYSKELAQRRDAYNKAYQDQQALNAQLQSLRDQQTAITRYWISTTVVDMYKITDATNVLSAAAQSYADRVNADIAARTISGQSGGSAGGATVGSGSGISEVIGGSGTPFPTPYGVYIGNGGTIGSFDNGGISMKPGIFYAGVPEAHIPLSMMGGIKVDVTIDARGSNMSPAEREKLKNETKTELVQAITAIHQGQKH